MQQQNNKPVANTPIRFNIDGAVLEGNLDVPNLPRALVVFLPDVSESRFSFTNRDVSHGLQQAGFATLRIDLFTHAEQDLLLKDGSVQHETTFLTARLDEILGQVKGLDSVSALPLYLFAKGTSSSAAYHVAHEHPESVQGVIACEGDLELVKAILPELQTPSLIVYGEYETWLNNVTQQNLPELAAPAHVHVVPGAGHVADDPNALKDVADICVTWMSTRLVVQSDRSPTAVHAS